MSSLPRGRACQKSDYVYSNPNGGKVNGFLQTIEWHRLCNSTSSEINKKIRKLIDFQETIPTSAVSYVNAVIHNMKIIGNMEPERRKRLKKRQHVLSDHAFCRVLELVCNLDVISMKDSALKMLEENENFEPIYSSDKKRIVTINDI